MNNKKIIVISDTHGDHRDIELPSGDILIHCGDLSDYRNDSRLYDFFEWFTSQDFKNFLVVPGNHDPELEMDDIIWKISHKYPKARILVDEAVKIDDALFYGTPYQPNYASLAFNRSEMELAIIYENIPEKTNVLITHSPPKGILDENTNGESIGSQSLLNRVASLVDLRYHVFGHVHEARGIFNNTFVNACYDRNKPYWELKL